MSNQSPNANSRDQEPQDPFSKIQERRDEGNNPGDEVWSSVQEMPGSAKVAAEEEGEDELDSTEDDEFEEADDEDDEDDEAEDEDDEADAPTE